MSVALEFQSKILSRKRLPDEYRIYRAALEWDLTDPIVIEGQEDFKSTPRWQDRLTPYHHQVKNLITFCRRLPVTLLADDVGLGNPPFTAPHRASFLLPPQAAAARGAFDPKATSETGRNLQIAAYFKMIL
jgi:hypothetical protein